MVAERVIGDKMEIRFYVDVETGQPHIYEHGVTEEEVYHIYVPDEERDSLFVITAYDLMGKALKAFRRRQRRRLS